jgi:hypothetical protein
LGFPVESGFPDPGRPLDVATIVAVPGSSRRAVIGGALIGTIVSFVLLLLDIRASGQGLERPIRAGMRGPSAEAVAQDFPDVDLPDVVGLDGQQFYAIARDPWHPKAVARHLDDARYRYQRPLLPVLAWALHPSGGGPGLVIAFVVLNVLGLFVGAVALGTLSVDLGGRPWLGGLYPLLPGALWSLLDSVSDGLAVALSLIVIIAFLRGRNRAAAWAAVAAVLVKETTILVPLALVIAHRRRANLWVVVAPIVAVVAWFAVIQLLVPTGQRPDAMALPFGGIIESFRTNWSVGEELIGMASVVSAVIVGIYVLARRLGPLALRWVIALQLVVVALGSADVVGTDFGATRTTLMLLAAGVVALSAATGSRPEGDPAAPDGVLDSPATG